MKVVGLGTLFFAGAQILQASSKGFSAAREPRACASCSSAPITLVWNPIEHLRGWTKPHPLCSRRAVRSRPAHLRFTLLACGITDPPQFDALLNERTVRRTRQHNARRKAEPRTSTPPHAHGGSSRTTTSGSFLADLRDRVRSQPTSIQHTAAPAMTKTLELPVCFRFQYCWDCWLYLRDERGGVKRRWMWAVSSSAAHISAAARARGSTASFHSTCSRIQDLSTGEA